MPDLQFGLSAYKRDRGDLPELPLINMFVEAAVTEPSQIVLQSRPALVASGVTLGGGPVAALFQKDGVAGGDLIGVSAAALYIDAVNVGAVAGAGYASIAGNEIGVVATAGETMKFHDGATLQSVAFPDAANVRKVIEQGGRFIMLRDGSQTFYWTDAYGDMLVAGNVVVDGLNYASAESEPDQLLDALAFEDAIALFGTATIEFWSKTGDADLPYVPSTGRVFQKGIRATGCAAVFDNTFAWVSPDNIVYLAGNVPSRISDSGIEERVAASATCRIDTFYFEGHEFLKVSLAQATMLYDAQTRQWCEFQTYELDAFAGGAVAGDVFGSLEDGRLLTFSGYTELGGTFERRFRAGFALNGGTVEVSNARLRVNSGQAIELTGEYAEPKVEMRTSRDAGQTWRAWRAISMGAQGKYRERVEWRALGTFDDPGFLAEFRTTDPVKFRVSGCSINEAGGGRSR